MTRKDYVLIAEALRRAKGSSASPSDDQHAHDCAMIANALAADNTAFDRARFLRDAGVAS